MRLLLMIIMSLAIGGGIYYFTITSQHNLKPKIDAMQSDAQKKAAIYKKTQEDMMKQIQ